MKSNDRLYFVWRDIRRKSDYDTKGICEEWLNNFDSFKEWCLFNGYQYDGEFSYYIQRKNKKLPFGPENCFFRAQQKRQTEQIKTEMKIISEVLKAKICKEYVNTKKSSRTLARENNLCQRTILNILKEKNIDAMSKKISVENLPGEIWKYINGTDNAYMVSNKGRIKRNKTYLSYERILVLGDDNGYKRIMLPINGKPKTKKVHTLVAEHFLENPNNYKIVNHKNEKRDDNRVENLEWCNQRYNVNYSSGKKIISINPITNERKEYLSIQSVKDYGYNPSNVVKVLKGIRTTHGGLIWKYKDEH